MDTIEHEIWIGAATNEVYCALTTAAGIRNWWTKDADLDNKVGGEGVFT
ncbi:MAG: hypothetical protein JST68_00590 [Bacteroidetes bacterium]|nr:hypothetical protein [Bacteroidota bacterium]